MTVNRGGFTLVEAVVSLVLSSLVVMLISTVFVVQTDFYETQLQRSAAQDNARTSTDLVSRELRSAMAGAVVVANDTQLVVRSPLAVAAVCATQSNHAHVYFSGGEPELDTASVNGVGIYNDTTGTWSYYAANWSDIDDSRGDSDRRCADNGADTLGVSGHFNRLERLANLHGSIPPEGTLVMFYHETEFVLTESALAPGVIGLYKGTYGQVLTEFASGFDDAAGFLYRTGGTTYSSPVTGAALATIDAVRLVVATRARAPSGGRDDITAGWSIIVPLRNAN